MKRKVKKYAGGNLVDSSGNPVRSGSGEPVRTRSDDEIAEDNKAGYGRYMPKLTRSITLGGKSSAAEDRPTSSGVDDYETMGKRAGATSPFSGPKEYISESIKESETDMEEPRRKISDYITSKSTSDASENEKPVVKKKAVKKAAAKPASQSFPIRDRDRADQSFPLKTDYDKMKGRKAGGSIKMASGGKVSSASSRGDGIAQRGKTRGKMC
jgi:hypothetical protein